MFSLFIIKNTWRNQSEQRNYYQENVNINYFTLEAVNYYYKALHLGCCSSPRSASKSINEKQALTFLISITRCKIINVYIFFIIISLFTLISPGILYYEQGKHLRRYRMSDAICDATAFPPPLIHFLLLSISI